MEEEHSTLLKKLLKEKEQVPFYLFASEAHLDAKKAQKYFFKFLILRILEEFSEKTTLKVSYLITGILEDNYTIQLASNSKGILFQN